MDEKGLMFKLNEVTPFFLLLFGMVITLIGFSIRNILASLNEKIGEIKISLKEHDSRVMALEKHSDLVEHRVKTLEESHKKLVSSSDNKERYHGNRN